jgi:hypothetical protein
MAKAAKRAAGYSLFPIARHADIERLFLWLGGAFRLSRQSGR